MVCQDQQEETCEECKIEVRHQTDHYKHAENDDYLHQKGLQLHASESLEFFLERFLTQLLPHSLPNITFNMTRIPTVPNHTLALSPAAKRHCRQRRRGRGKGIGVSLE